MVTCVLGNWHESGAQPMQWQSTAGRVGSPMLQGWWRWSGRRPGSGGADGSGAASCRGLGLRLPAHAIGRAAGRTVSDTTRLRSHATWLSKQCASACMYTRVNTHCKLLVPGAGRATDGMQSFCSSSSSSSSSGRHQHLLRHRAGRRSLSSSRQELRPTGPRSSAPSRYLMSNMPCTLAGS